MLRSLTAAFLLTLTIPTQPVLADEVQPAAIHWDVTLRNPWIASGLSLTTPVLLWTGSFSAFGVAAPFGVGAGHFYAGDPARGAWVTLGGVGAFLAGWAWGYYGPNDDLRPRRLNNAVFDALTATLVYSVWSAWDAYHTAERVNFENLSAPLPGTGPLP